MTAAHCHPSHCNFVVAASQAGPDTQAHLASGELAVNMAPNSTAPSELSDTQNVDSCGQKLTETDHNKRCVKVVTTQSLHRRCIAL